MTATLGKIAADFSTTLNLKTAIWATSATLDSATDDDGVALPTWTYFLTLDRKSANKEYIKCTLTGTALTDIYHVSRQGVLTSGTTKTHRKGATVEITDFAIIKKMLDLLDGTNDLNASVPLKYDGTATISNANHLATKAYVDGIAIAGSPDATTSTKGITTMSVAPVSAATPIAVGDNDGRVPTQDENDALAGTSGTPSGSNKYVTADDVAENTASKAVRRKSDSNITVPTTPIAWTDAASKSYIDTLIAAITPVYEQQIGILASTSTSSPQFFKITSETDGSALYVATQAAAWDTLSIRRYAKNTVTGKFMLSHTATFQSVGASTWSTWSLAVVGSYVYVVWFSAGGGTIQHKRFDKATLLNPVTLTLSWTIFANGSACTTNGTDLLVYESSDTFRKYTISGTTITNAGTITFTSAGAVNNGSAIYDGTYIHITWGALSNLKKYNPTWWAAVSSISWVADITQTYPNVAREMLFIVKTGVLGYGLPFTVDSNAAVVGLIAIFAPFTATTY